MALVLPHSVFFHIPKTGGTFVRDSVKRCAIPTTEAKQSHCLPRDVDLRAKKSFCFVRNPLTWYQSYWAYRMRRGVRRDTMFDPYIDDDFHRFVLKATGAGPLLTRQYERFTSWPVKVSFIGKSEQLEDDLIRALALFGERFDPEIIRNTPPNNQSASLKEYAPLCKHTRQTWRAIVQVEKMAFKRYGYKW